MSVPSGARTDPLPDAGAFGDAQSELLGGRGAKPWRGVSSEGSALVSVQGIHPVCARLAAQHDLAALDELEADALE